MAAVAPLGVAWLAGEELAAPAGLGAPFLRGAGCLLAGHAARPGYRLRDLCPSRANAPSWPVYFEASLACYAKAMKATTIASPFVTQPASRKPAIGRPCVGRVAMTAAERACRYRKLAKKRRRAANFEWYTPPDIIALAVETMGGIDCDPASCVEANQVVGAKVFYTLDDDGLRQQWFGRVFLNPPYSKISSFVEKIVTETAAGRATEAIVISSNASDVRWFQKCVSDGRGCDHQESVRRHPAVHRGTATAARCGARVKRSIVMRSSPTHGRDAS
jgi:phage N-6-adenine-methyltransferase